MRPVDPSSPWSSFAHDPRDPAYAALRASDRDRDVVHGVLDEAYADGRLDLEELDERRAAAAAARTLGDLPPLVGDLVPTVPAVRPPATDLARATPETIHELAVAAWRRDLREAVATFLVPSVICLVIWAVVMFGGFFWPAFVMLGTGANLLQTLLRRDDIVADHARKLEKKQARALRPKEDGA